MSIILRKHEISNLRLDNYLTIKENDKTIVFEEIDKVKIFILETKKNEKFLEEHYYGEIKDDSLLSYNDYWHLREWYFFKDSYASDDVGDKIRQNFINRRKKTMEDYYLNKDNE